MTDAPLTDDFRVFLVKYRHDGADWILELRAQDESDAKKRLETLAQGEIEGEVVATIPSAFSALGWAAAAVRNALRRRP